MSDSTTAPGPATQDTLLGRVVLCQVHTDRMVNSGVYDASMIVPVDELWLSEDGVVGVADTQVLVHAHHRLHPNKYRAVNQKDFRPNRLISIGFTGHHELICDRFGPADLGIGAEDVIVETDRRINLDELAGGVEIRSETGNVRLDGVAVAKPCVPFTKYLLGDQDAADDLVGPNREFLNDGMRGFVFGLAGYVEPALVAAGAEVWACASPD